MSTTKFAWNEKITSNYVRTVVVIAINFHIVPCYGGKHEQRGPHAHNCHNGQLRHAEPMDLLSSRHLLNTDQGPMTNKNTTFFTYSRVLKVKRTHLWVRWYRRHIITVPKGRWKISRWHWTRTFCKKWRKIKALETNA